MAGAVVIVARSRRVRRRGPEASVARAWRAVLGVDHAGGGNRERVSVLALASSALASALPSADIDQGAGQDQHRCRPDRDSGNLAGAEFVIVVATRSRSCCRARRGHYGRQARRQDTWSFGRQGLAGRHLEGGVVDEFYLFLQRPGCILAQCQSQRTHARYHGTAYRINCPDHLLLEAGGWRIAIVEDGGRVVDPDSVLGSLSGISTAKPRSSPFIALRLTSVVKTWVFTVPLQKPGPRPVPVSSQGMHGYLKSDRATL